ncbi:MULTISPECIES: hypothetical protein [unclassified Ruegeria]|uniref:hypothetical protein n=1 Tax=unclassified Ruegeria TaxID=2625375 RepID=UPI001ADB9290|nr:MULTISPECIES: hypothetical protein [unclassified Ruegeria]MBO9410404.1 hypothetical protein [Ruegeria sp. R8_1]MBO9414377.1 hypothetical protein [Ruegeria sp. R8_2]
MTITQITRTFLVLLMLAALAPADAYAKPNSYPGENSKFNSKSAVGKWEADRAKRIEERKKRREERRLKRLNEKNNRSN